VVPRFFLFMSSAYCPRPTMSYGQHTWTFCYKHFEIKTFFRRWVLWSAWHLVKLPLCQLDIYSICYLVDTQIGKLLFIQLVFQQLSALPACTFVGLPFGQLAVLPIWHLFNLSFGWHTDRQLVVNPTGISTTLHAASLHFCQLPIWSTCYFVNLPYV